VQRARRSSVEGEDEYAFRHLLVRDVAYGQIPRAARVDKHCATADWVEALSHPAIMDTTKAKEELGWRPKYTALEALRETLPKQ